MLVPPINGKGLFKFAPPFDSLINTKQELTVNSVRSLVELADSEETPLDTIYKSIGLTEAEFQSDLDNDVPIVVFVTEGKEYIYVPANRVLSIPKINGVKYQEKIIAISLGNIPIDLDLTLITDTIKNDVRDIIGVESEPKIVLGSAVAVIDIDEHNQYEALRTNSKSVFKSYRTQLLELQEEHNRVLNIKNELEKYIKDNHTA